MPDFAVSVAIRGDDRITADLRRMSRGVDRFGRNAKRSFGMASRAAGMFRSVLGGVLAANVISRGFAALNMGIGETVRGFVDMDQALTSAGAKFQLSNMSAQDAAAAMQSLSQAARETGAQTEFTATQAAQGLEFLAMAGFDAKQAIAAMPAMVDLATASNTDLARASDIASDALGAFGLASDNATVQAQNLERITDVFAQTTASANVDMENLFETFKMGGPIMTTAGQSLESFASITAVMGNAGIKGSLAGTTLKNAIQRLVAPVGKAKTQLKQLGVVVEDGQGNMRDIALILDDFAKATEDMGDAQRTAAISTVFGMRAVSGISTILDKGIPTLRGFRKGLEGAQGASKRMADEMRSSLLNRLKTLKSSLMEAGMRVIEAFHQNFPGAIDSAIEAVRNFNVQPIIDGIRTIIGFVKDAWDWFDRWKAGIITLVAAFGIFKAAIALTGTVSAIIAVAKGAATATEVWAGAQWALNIAMLANPITLIIALILALIAVIAIVIIYWDEIAAGWTNLMTEIYTGANETTNAISEFFAGLATPIVNIAIEIGNVFGEVWHTIKSGISATVAFVINAVRKLQGVLGVEMFDLPSEGEIDKWFGVDKPFEARGHVTEGEIAQGYKDAFKMWSEVMGAETGKGKAPIEAPNKSRSEMYKKSFDMNAEIDIYAPEGYSTQTRSSTVNGKKAPGVVRTKAGQNKGAA